MLGSAFPLSFSKTQALLEQLLGMTISRSVIAAIRKRLSAALQQPKTEDLEVARQQPIAYVDETGAPSGNPDGNNPNGKRGWHWVMVTPLVKVFLAFPPMASTALCCPIHQVLAHVYPAASKAFSEPRVTVHIGRCSSRA
jgi:hypothetical protein